MRRLQRIHGRSFYFRRGIAEDNKKHRPEPKWSD